MDDEINGDSNNVAGRDIYIQRVQALNDKIEKITEIFTRIDKNFCEATGSNKIKRKDEIIEFSSEALCTSLVTIGIPISTSLDVVEGIIPILIGRLELRDDDGAIVTTNDVKLCVLQALTGLQFRYTKPESSSGSAQISTWSSAYVRRYGGSNMYLKVIDNGIERDLNYEYLKEYFIPHLLETIIGAEKGEDVVKKYKKFFSVAVIERMATEIIGFANTLNIYSIRYKTLYHLTKDTVLSAPHPWLVTRDNKDNIVSYNVERALHHWNFINSHSMVDGADYFRPSAHECAAHLSAAILAHYGCMLGVETRYGLSELIRVCEIKKSNDNLAMWEYCELFRLESDLDSLGMSLSTLIMFLKRLQSSLALRYGSALDAIGVIENCKKLHRVAYHITRHSDLSAQSN